ncbi:MAG TPA: RIP metalloprotease RseP [Rhabdochlamydiaceae bacterium]|nr:RIP metalloprotease RseP [Rhabdochlamydiaceae bacterium]
MISLLYLILAILGLGFLIFIHELGHYIVARRVGMTVEVFSIGFGPPLRQWVVGGVKWQLSMLPFGGYVKIAGMEKKGTVEPHQIPDGFYGKKPIDRIKVALAGPAANVLFAFIAFCAIWLTGGQEKPFQQYTHVVGYVDPQSTLYTKGVRPGDEILFVGNKKLDGYQDFLISLMTEEKGISIQGNEINYFSEKKEPFKVALPPPTATTSNLDQAGVLPAQYLIFDDYSSPASPIRNSGIQKGDRIVWVDGELIFSQKQLSSVLNDSKTLLTVQRDGKDFLAQVPRLKISDLRLQDDQKHELGDLQHAAGLKAKINQLFFIPYLVNQQGVVETAIAYMNQEAEEVKPSDQFRQPLTQILRPGDRIIAVDGVPIANSQELLSKLQTRHALIIVERGEKATVPSWEKADQIFEKSFNPNTLSSLITTIGCSPPLVQKENLVLLSPVMLKPLSELQPKGRYEAQKQLIEKIEDPKIRDEKLKYLENEQKKLLLGARLHDNIVVYNPSSLSFFSNVFDQTWKTLTNLVSGSVSPKNLAGPVGIIQALQYSWASGIKDALFWLGFVSLNLAIINLLPLPVLDGGHILFAAIEGVTKKPIKAKTMEKFITPFIILLIGLFIYLTYQDIIRLITRLW